MKDKNVELGERAPPQKKSPVGSGNKTETNAEFNVFCTNCGSKVNSANRFCEFCGFNLNTVDNGGQNYKKHMVDNHSSKMYQRPPVSEKKLTSGSLDWKTIIKGGILAVVLSALLGFILGLFLFEISIYTFIAMAAIINIISLFIGSLYAGSKAMNNGATHGLMAGVVCVLISQPINLLAGIPISIAAIFGAIIWGMIIGVIGGFVGSKLGKLSSVNQPQATSQTYYS